MQKGSNVMALVSSSFLCFALSFAVVKEWGEHGKTFTKINLDMDLTIHVFPMIIDHKGCFNP